MRFLLTGARAPVALDLSRCLHQAGHEVHVADVFINHMIGRSKAIAGFHTYAPPRSKPMAFQADVRDLVSDLGIEMIIPLCEEVFYLAQAAKVFPLPLFAPDLDTLMRLHSKLEFAHMAHGLGLFVPETYLLEARTLEALRPHAKRLVFKPEFSRFGSQTLIRPRPEALDELAEDPHNPWLYQDYVDGEDVSFYAIAQAGRLAAFSAYRSNWRTGGGASYYFDPLPADQAAALRLIAHRLIESQNLTGQLACDLRRDSQGTFWLIEANPRATSGLHLLTPQSGPLSAILTGALSDPPLEASTQAFYVGPAMWFSGLPNAIMRGRFKEWQADMKRGQDVVAPKGDSGPIWGALLDAIIYGARALWHRQNLSHVLTSDIACNQRLR